MAKQIRLNDRETFELRFMANYYLNLDLNKYNNVIELISEFNSLCSKYGLDEKKMTKKYLFKEDYYLVDKLDATNLIVEQIAKSKKYNKNDLDILNSNDDYFLTNHTSNKNAKFYRLSGKHINNDSIYELLLNELKIELKINKHPTKPYALLPKLNRYLNENSISFSSQPSKYGYLEINLYLLNFKVFIVSYDNKSNTKRVYIFHDNYYREYDFGNGEKRAINFIGGQMRLLERRQRRNR